MKSNRITVFKPPCSRPFYSPVLIEQRPRISLKNLLKNYIFSYLRQVFLRSGCNFVLFFKKTFEIGLKIGFFFIGFTLAKREVF
jgi:hypothetical protein